MKIGINLTDLIFGKIGGMETYIRSLVHFFPLISPKDKFCIVGYSSILGDIKEENIFKIVIKKSSTREEQSELLKQLIIENKFDVWFSPLLILDPLNCPVPSAFTIPDMQHEYYPEFFDSVTLNWRKKYFQASADKADMIFTLSKNSRNDIIRFLDVAPKKIKAIHLDSPSWFEDKPIFFKDILNIVKKYGQKNFLFYPANTWPHKNHLRLLEAFNRVKNQIDNVNLLFSGYPQQADKEIGDFIKKNYLKKRVYFLGYLKKEKIPLIYRNSLGLIFPSLFEGFGIPIIEAFRSSCPVLCANNTSIMEIAGDAALYFDGLSVSEISNSILKFVSDKDLRKMLIKKGHERAKQFSYKKTAKQTLKYLKLIAQRKNIDGDINKKFPKISVITPSYNQGKFIERTIKSVLDQKYPNLEYIVIDGGSTDDTLEVLKKYSSKLKWISEKDKGQADAINKGIRISTGQILSYLNSDDIYEAGSLEVIANYFTNNPEAMIVHGKGKHIDKNDKYIEDYPSKPTDYLGLHPTCSICQPTTFWRRELVEEIGYFDESLKYAMDYDYWIKSSMKYPINFIYKYLASTRFYAETKTSGQRPKVHREIIEVQKRYYNKVHANWILALVHAKLEKNKRLTVYENTKFLIILIFASFYGFLKFNHRLPPLIVWRYYLIWFKEIFAFIKRKIYKSFF
ncbi:MAG: glycosyltransferase [Patescibacteria group bacterium]